MDKLLSIVIPVYNAEDVLHFSVESILENDYHNFELILINDGSTDASLDVINSYAKKDNRLKVITRENRGAGATRNEGIKVSKGEYIAFCDADDWIDKGMYSYLISILDSNTDIVYAECGKRWHYSNTTKILEPPRDKTNRLCTCKQALVPFFKNELFHWGPCDMVFRKSAIDGVEFPDFGVAEDMRFHLRVFSKNPDKLYFSSDDPNTPKYNYNKKLSTNLLNQNFGTANFCHLDFYDEYEQLSTKLGLESLADKCYAEKCKRLISYGAKATSLKIENYKQYVKNFTQTARKGYKKAMKNKSLGIALKLDYTLFCVFPSIMNRVNKFFIKAQ